MLIYANSCVAYMGDTAHKRWGSSMGWDAVSRYVRSSGVNAQRSGSGSGCVQRSGPIGIPAPVCGRVACDCRLGESRVVCGLCGAR